MLALSKKIHAGRPSIMLVARQSRRAEMLGLPGAGKSWLYTKLCERLQGSIAPYEGVGQTAPPQVSPLAVEQNTVVAEFMALSDRMLDEGDVDRTLRRRRKTWVAREMARVILAECSRDRPVLLDEGLVQRGLSVASSYEVGQAIAQGYFASVPPPRAVILIVTPDHVVRSRIGERGDAQKYHLDTYARNAAHIRTGVRILKERGVETILADGAKLIDEPAAEIDAIAEELRDVMR